MVVRGAQIRAARSLLGWSQAELAKKAGVAHMTIRRFEAHDGPVSGNISSLTRVQDAFEKAGIEFIPPDEGGSFGVRLNPSIKAKK
ncbi:MAG: helix-turn-helix domain-containing protein [Nitrospirales bacterium]